MGYQSGKKSCWTLFFIKGFSSKKLFQISHYCESKNPRAGKIFGKIRLKTIRDIFFSNSNQSVIRGGTGTSNFLCGKISNRKGKFKLLGLQVDPLQFPPLVGHSDLPIRKTVMRLLGLFTVMTLKTVIESVFLKKSTNLQHARLKTKSGGKPFIVFNLLIIIIYPFQGKQHLKTY